jgi:hypothetical protein
MQLVCVSYLAAMRTRGQRVLTRCRSVAVLPLVAAVVLVVTLLLDIAVFTFTDVKVDLLQQ